MEGLGSAIKRAVAQKKYKEEIYEPEKKTLASAGTRVDKRKFNKGRPRKTISPLGKDIVSAPVPAPTKKLNEIEKLAGYIIGGYLRSKLDAMDMQPAIYSDLIGKEINDKLNKGEAINFDKVVTQAKKRGRPVGAKDKKPRVKKQ